MSGYYLRLYAELFKGVLEEVSESGAKVANQLEDLRKKHIEDLNHIAAQHRAKIIGIDPKDNLETLRRQLNEKVILEVKTRKLRHIDVANIAQIPRSRVTAIMNRHLERVTIDCLIKILNILGISPIIQL